MSASKTKHTLCSDRNEIPENTVNGNNFKELGMIGTRQTERQTESDQRYEEFYFVQHGADCAVAATNECFDCVVSSCYDNTVSKLSLFGTHFTHVPP